MKFLSDYFIVEAEYNDQARELLPLKGELNQNFIVSSKKVLTPEDLEGVVSP